jgi:hypothetical protein
MLSFLKLPMKWLLSTALTDDFREPGELDLSREELVGPVPRRDVALAIMLMLAPEPWLRVDGMSLARQALDAPSTGDPRRDLKDYERGMLADGRARCLVLHCDLMLGSTREDPIVAYEASRYAEFAMRLAPDDAEVTITLALVRLRQRRAEEASELARRALEALGADPYAASDGRVQSAALLSMLILAISSMHMGDRPTAWALVDVISSAPAPLEVDEVGCARLIAELNDLLASDAARLPRADQEDLAHAKPLLHAWVP